MLRARWRSEVAAPPMNENIGWKATSSPAATAAQRWRGSSSRTRSTVAAAAIAPSSAETNRISVRRDQNEAWSAAR